MTAFCHLKIVREREADKVHGGFRNGLKQRSFSNRFSRHPARHDNAKSGFPVSCSTDARRQKRGARQRSLPVTPVTKVTGNRAHSRSNAVNRCAKLLKLFTPPCNRDAIWLRRHTASAPLHPHQTGCPQCGAAIPSRRSRPASHRRPHAVMQSTGTPVHQGASGATAQSANPCMPTTQESWITMSTPIQLDFAGCSITRRDIGLDERTTVVTIKFNQRVRGFDTSDVVLIPGNGADATSVPAVPPEADGGSDTWQVTLTAKVAGATSRNDNRITVNLAGVRDAEGNAGSGTSTIPSEQVQYNVDLARPSVTQFGLDDANLTTNELAQSPRLTIKFTDVITGLDATNFVLSNGFTLTNLTVNLAVDFTGKTWTATLVPPSSVSTTAVTQASIALNVNNRGIKDAAGNEIKQGSDQSFNFTIDPVPPRLISIAISDRNLKAGDTATVTFTFDEAVQG